MTSVKQKIAGIGKKREEIQARVRKMCGAIKEQASVNKAAVHQIGIGIRKVEDGMAKAAQEIGAGVKKLQGNIKEQEKVNNAAVNKLHGAIRNQANENKDYIKDFYFSESKK